MSLSLLSGTWSDITAFNYAVDPFALRPFVPSGTELDLFEDEAYLSVVALCFGQPHWLGVIPLPFRRFPMVTFRFYVKRRMPDGTIQRGTVFLKEFTPLTSVLTFARLMGKRDLQRAPVTTNIFPNSSYLFWWGRIVDNNWLEAKVEGEPSITTAGTLEDFIFEKEWDFVPMGTRKTLQYRCTHPRWRVWRAHDAEARIDIHGLLSGDIARALTLSPRSVFVAQGSKVKMHFPTLIHTRSPRKKPASIGSRFFRTIAGESGTSPRFQKGAGAAPKKAHLQT